MPTNVRRRGRALASLTATLGLGVATLAAVGGTSAAQAADPAAPAAGCPTPFPVAEVARGQQVTGLTVTQGTVPSPFTGEVIGVLEDGVTVGVDMIMVELDSETLREVGGVWQGMSGSPVHAEDGRLLGAVAYGLSFGPSLVAGLTPYADMDDYLGDEPAGAVPVGRAAARTIARRTDVTRAQAAQGFEQLRMPLGVTGLGPRRLAGAEAAADRLGKRRWLASDTYSLGSAADAAAADDVVPGGNLAASLSYGDVTQAGVGTVTSVCDGEVTAFGHPMGFFGETTLSLHPADVLYVQGESLGAPFKVANLADPVGTITDDRTTGLTGFLGALPDSVRIETDTAFAGRERSGVTHASVRTPDVLANTSFLQVVLNHDRVIDGMTTGSELMTWTITGTDADGTPFELSSTDRYTSPWDLSYEMGFALGDWVYLVSQIPGVELESVHAESLADADDDTLTVEGVEQRRGGEWVAVSRQRKIRARAGETLRLRYLLEGPDGTTPVPFTVDVPRGAARSRGDLVVTGGNWLWTRGRFTTVEQAGKKLANLVRNDQVRAQLELYPRGGGGRADRVVRRHDSAPFERVVEGRKRVRVVVR